MDLRDQEKKLCSLVEQILAEAKTQGADQAEVGISLDAGLSVEVRQGALENLEFNQDRGFGITVYVGQRKGSASTTDSSADAIRDTVAAAKNIATYTEEDPWSGLADAELMPPKLQDLDLFHPWDIEPEQAVQIAVACESAGLGTDERLNNSDGAQVNTQQSMRVYGNSHGFIGASAGTRHGLSCVLIGEDEQGMQRDYWYTTARAANDLEAAESVGRQAARRTLAKLSPRSAPTGTYPVLYMPTVASGFVGHLLGALNGGSLYREASFMLNSMGHQILPSWMTLREQPHLRGGLGSALFDGDGVATRSKAFVDNGVVANYVLSAYAARRLDMQPTGNAGGVFNLDVDGPATEVSKLLRQMGRGLVVSELMGQGVNIVTGDYSRGASGFWVEDGEIAYPVAEVTVAGNLKELYPLILGLGNDCDYRGNIRSPSILLEAMTVAGTSA